MNQHDQKSQWDILAVKKNAYIGVQKQVSLYIHIVYLLLKVLLKGVLVEDKRNHHYCQKILNNFFFISFFPQPHIFKSKTIYI